MVDKVLVGRKIFILRKKIGITQDHLAKIIHLTPQAISRWENGLALPDANQLPFLAELFQVSIEELLCIKPHQKIIDHAEESPVLLPGILNYSDVPSLSCCIKSSLDYLGKHVSMGWISAPYAFMLSIDKNVSARGTNSWNDSGFLGEMIRNCGGILEHYFGSKGEVNIELKRKVIRNKVQNALNKGLPCIAWEMDKPQYYLITGYDNIGYYFIDRDSSKSKGPKPYSELGKGKSGKLEIYIVNPGNISSNLETLKCIFEYATNIGNLELYPQLFGVTIGVGAYQTWWRAIESGNADHYGLAYNSLFWAKCKNLAVRFLREGKFRVGSLDELFSQAIAHYKSCAKSLNLLTQMFPINTSRQMRMSQKQKIESVRLLKIAQKSETSGLADITDILNELYKMC
jgi:transcriptional regulator with XRE-family HTH domain